MNTTFYLTTLILTIIHGAVTADSKPWVALYALEEESEGGMEGGRREEEQEVEYVSIDSPESVDDCAKLCPFSTFEEAIKTEPNRYKLWTAFHYPREFFPQLLVVSYSLNVSDNNTAYNINDTYLNTIYLVFPLHMFSLFLGVLDKQHRGEVNLTLPCECTCWLEVEFYTNSDNSTLNYLEVLTEKV